MSANFRRRLCGFLALVVGLTVAAHCFAESSIPVPLPNQKCPNNLGPCFGTGTCEAYWNDAMFDCGELGIGKSLKQTNFIWYGVCQEVDEEICTDYGTLDCANVTIYRQPGCVAPFCSRAAQIFNKCHN
jgi:hypothetical protein